MCVEHLDQECLNLSDVWMFLLNICEVQWDDLVEEMKGVITLYIEMMIIYYFLLLFWAVL